MAELSFAGAAAQTDRRRRLMAGQPADQVDPAESLSRGTTSEQLALGAFPMLSRDQLIRKVFSPRTWKHGLAAALLIAVPAVLETALLRGQLNQIAADSYRSLAFSHRLRAFTGLELFVSAQIALLIGWVRASSTVDFRGRFRAWHWIAGVLCLMSVVLLTDTYQFATDQIAALLHPVLGDLNAARPALLLVPGVAVLAFILRSLIPDLGRCRPAQGLLIAGILCAVVRLWPGLDRVLTAAPLQLAVLELLAGGLVLSAFQLHGRFVIHVNPHPPAPRLRAARAETRRNAATVEQSPPATAPQVPAAPDVVPISATAGDTTELAVEDTPRDAVPAQKPADRTPGKTEHRNKGGSKTRRRAG